MDLFTLKRLLGHDFLDTTQRYIDVGMGKWRPDYLKYHELARRPADANQS
jgi:site-specific recombinase XerD